MKHWHDLVSVNLFWLGLNIRNNAVGALFLDVRLPHQPGNCRQYDRHADDRRGSLYPGQRPAQRLAGRPFGAKAADRLERPSRRAGALIVLGTIWLPNLDLIYVAGCLLGLAAGLFTTINWALGTRLVPPAEAGRYLGISNLAGAGAGMIGTGIGGPMADYLNSSLPGLGYFVIFAGYGVLFLLSVVSLRWISEA
jgi:MFS family permease